MNPTWSRHERTRYKSADDGDPDVLTSTGVATYLGVTPDSVRRFARQGDLPFLRTEGALRVFEWTAVEVFRKQRDRALVVAHAQRARRRRLAAVQPHMLRMAPRQPLVAAANDQRSTVGGMTKRDVGIPTRKVINR